MTSSIVRTFAGVGLVVALCACGSHSSSTTTTTTDTSTASSAATSPASSNASAISSDAAGQYQKFFAGEDNDFADIKGAQRSDEENVTTYASNASLPGKDTCTINVNKENKAIFGNCEYIVATRAEADAKMLSLKGDAMAAEPGMTEKTMPMEKGNVAQAYVANSKRAVEVYVQKGDKGKFVAGIYFATPDNFKKTWGDNTP